MAFQTYTAPAQGYRAQSEGCISIGKSRIGLGLYKLPFDYAVIHYDKEAQAIMFTAGVNGDGFKVTKDPKGKTQYLAAKSFTNKLYLPYGVYRRTDDKDEIFKRIN